MSQEVAITQEAKDFAKYVYNYHGDYNKALHEVHKRYGGHINAYPDANDIKSQRISELSSAYLGVIRDEHTQGRVGRVARDHWDRAIMGLEGDSGRGNTLAPSQHMAIVHNKPQFLTDYIKDDLVQRGNAVIGHDGEFRMDRKKLGFPEKGSHAIPGQRGHAKVGLLGTIATAATAVLAIGSVTKAEAKTPGFEDKNLGDQVTQVATSFAKQNIPGAETALNGNKASGAYQFGSSVAAGVVGGTAESGTTAIIKGVGGGPLTASFMAVAAMTSGMRGQKMSTGIVDAWTAGKNAVGTVERYINGLNPFETGPGVTQQTSITPTTPSGPGAGPF